MSFKCNTSSRVLAAILLLACCELSTSERPQKTPQATIVIDVDHRFGASDFALGLPFASRYGATLTVDEVRYWISDVALHQGMGQSRHRQRFFLVENTGRHVRTRIEVGDLVPGTYDALSLRLGVAAPFNGDPRMTHGELQGGLAMDWSPEPGYMFMRAHGSYLFETSSGYFDFRVGDDTLYRRLRVNFNEPLVIGAGESVAFTLVADLERLFAGIAWPEQSTINGGDATTSAGQLFENFSNLFALETSEGRRYRFAVDLPNSETMENGAIPQDSTPPFFSVGVIDFVNGLRCDPVPNRPFADEQPCFIAFGQETRANSTEGIGRFGWVTRELESVVSASAGVVSEVRATGHSPVSHQELYTVIVRPKEDSAFFVEYSNLMQPAVVLGQALMAGEELGKAGDYFAPGFGMVAFGVRRAQEATQYLCPIDFFDSPVRGQIEAALRQSQKAWPSFGESPLCQSASLLCIAQSCEGRNDFIEVGGDVDRGRRIYAASCASCHGIAGEGLSGPSLCLDNCSCASCRDQATLAARIALDMPPEGKCEGACAQASAAFILHGLYEAR